MRPVPVRVARVVRVVRVRRRLSGRTKTEIMTACED